MSDSTKVKRPVNEFTEKKLLYPHETLSYYAFPQSHWRHLRTNNPLERIMKEIRRRTRVVGSFPDGESALMLVAARLRHVSGTRWGTRLYMNMQRLCECDEREALTTA